MSGTLTLGGYEFPARRYSITLHEVKPGRFMGFEPPTPKQNPEPRTDTGYHCLFGVSGPLRFRSRSNRHKRKRCE